jgi:hypothetical protein
MQFSKKAALLIGSMAIVSTIAATSPVSSEPEHTTPETSAITADDLRASYQAGYAERDDQALAFEDGYYAGLEDAAMCCPVDVANAPQEKVNRLRNTGYWGDPTDGMEALYSPDCTHGDVINPLGESGKKVDAVIHESKSLPSTGGSYIRPGLEAEIEAEQANDPWKGQHCADVVKDPTDGNCRAYERAVGHP